MSSSSSFVIGKELKSLSDKLTNLSDLLNTSKDLINSYASSANSSTTKSTYNEYVSKYTAEKQNFETLLSSYEELGGKYNISLEKYNTMTFSEKAEVLSYDLPNPKDKFEWLAGGEFYNQKNAGGYIWSATNPLAPDEKPNSSDLGYVINKGDIHPYLNEGFAEVQSEIRGFGFLDLLGNYRDTQVVSYEVTLTVVTSDGSTLNFSNTFDDTSGMGGDGVSFNNMAQSSMGVNAVANIMSTPGVDLMSLNAIGVAQYAITSMINGKTFTSPKEQIGNMIASSLMNTVENIAAQKTTLALARALGIKSTIAMGVINIGVGALIGELADMVMGYDNSFGFGGEYNAQASKALGVAGYEKAEGFMGISTAIDKASFSLGLTDSYSSDITTFNGSTLGFQSQFDDGKFSFTETFDISTGATTLTAGSMFDSIAKGLADVMDQAKVDAQNMMDQLDSFNDNSYGGSEGSGDGGMGSMGPSASEGGTDAANNGDGARGGENGTGFA